MIENELPDDTYNSLYAFRNVARMLIEKNAKNEDTRQIIKRRHKYLLSPSYSTQILPRHTTAIKIFFHDFI